MFLKLFYSLFSRMLLMNATYVLLKWFISKPNLRIVPELLCEEPNSMEPRVLHQYIRGVARIFQRGGHRQGHHPGIADYIWFISLLSLVYQRAQSYYRGMKAHINLREEPLTKILYKKINFKKVGFSTMASTAKILSWRFRHLNIVGCLLKRRPTKGGSRAPQDPPLATPL